MDMQKLQQKIAQINELIANETADVGLDIIAAALSHAIVSWVASDLMTIYVNPSKVKSTKPGYCFLKAGWRYSGKNKNGKLIIMEALK